MAVLEILKIGHPILTKKAAPVERIDDAIRALAKNLVETLHAAPGLGLSAPQVNVSKRLIAVDLSLGERPEEEIVLINPEILLREGKVVRDEGCLSVPETYEKVSRPQKIVIKGLDIEGKERTIEAVELRARVFCHEVDHLDGKLFIDWLSPLKRNLIKKKFRKKAELDKK
jgi:peptide deformylase